MATASDVTVLAFGPGTGRQDLNSVLSSGQSFVIQVAAGISPDDIVLVSDTQEVAPKSTGESWLKWSWSLRLKNGGEAIDQSVMQAFSMGSTPQPLDYNIDPDLVGRGFALPLQPTGLLRIEFADGTVWGQSDIIAQLTQSSSASGVDVYGSNAADLIIGDGRDHTIRTFDGDDTVVGSSGDEIIVGGAGVNEYRIDGGFGRDIVSGNWLTDRIVLGAGLTKADLRVSTNGVDLIVQQGPGSTNTLVLSGFAANWANMATSTGSISFADGSAWRFADLTTQYFPVAPVAIGSTIEYGTTGNDVFLIGPGRGIGTIAAFQNDAAGLHSDVIQLTTSDVSFSMYHHDMTQIGVMGGHLNDQRGVLIRFNETGETTLVYDTRAAFSPGGWSSGLIYTNDFLKSDQVVIRLADGSALTGLDLAARMAAEAAPTTGTFFDDTVRGTVNDDILAGGRGDDQIIVSDSTAPHGRDVVLFNLGDGRDTVVARDGGYTLRLGVGIQPADIALNNGVAIRGTVDSLWGPLPDRIEFADGTVWDAQQIGVQQHVIPGGISLSASQAGDTLVGGGGHDVLKAAPEGGSVLIGGAGNDTISLIGYYDGPANVIVFQRGDGSDTVDGVSPFVLRLGDGISRSDLQFSASGVSMGVNASGGLDQIKGALPSRIEFADGSKLDQADIRVISSGVTTSGDDTVDGLNGTSDVIDGLGGNDSLSGWAGNDSLIGGIGNDTLDGGEGSDTLVGGAGSDKLLGAEGDDLMIGGAGLDSYEYASYTRFIGRDVVSDTDGARIWLPGTSKLASDVLVTAAGPDHPKGVTIQVKGAIGSITIDNIADANDVAVIAASGPLNKAALLGLVQSTDSRTHVGTGVGDALTATLGFDTLDGQGGNDTLTGSTGQDVFIGGAGDDLMDGQGGADLFLYEGTDIGNDTIKAGADAVIQIKGDGLIVDSISVDPLDAAKPDQVTMRIAGVAGSITVVRPSSISEPSIYLNGRYYQGSSLWVQAQANAAYLLTGTAGNDTLDGKKGADTLIGGAGNDALTGGAGADTYLYNDTLIGDDTIQADAADTIVFAGNALSRDDLVLAPVDQGDGYVPQVKFGVKGFSGSVSVFNTVGSVQIGHDTLTGVELRQLALERTAFSQTGTDGADLIQGRSGKDTLSGQAGDDTIIGGDGNDILIGGRGHDQLRGDAGADSYRYNDRFIGNDTIHGDGLDRIVFTGASLTRDDITFLPPDAAHPDQLSFSLKGYEGSITVDNYAAASNMVLDLGTKSLTLAEWLESPSNTTPLNIVGTADGDVINGRNGGDILSGQAGNDTISGRDGNDVLIGGEGDDVLAGEAGADTYRYDAAAIGQDVIHADSNDTIVFAGAALGTSDLNVAMLDTTRPNQVTFGVNGYNGSVTIDNLRDAQGLTLQLGGVAVSGANLLDMATSLLPLSLYGSNGADVLNGHRGADTLHGGAGNDTLAGGDGNDVLIGDAGDDFLRGDAGADTYFYDIVSDNIIGHDVIHADGSDTIAFAPGWLTQDDLTVLAFDPAKPDQLTFGVSGFDGSVLIDNLGAAQGLTLKLGTVNMSGADLLAVASSYTQQNLVGTSGADMLNGLNGADSLNGMAGNDSLAGGKGADTLIGGAGNDYLHGDDGVDTYRYDDANIGNDVIHADNLDTIVFTQATLTQSDLIVSPLSSAKPDQVTFRVKGYNGSVTVDNLRDAPGLDLQLGSALISAQMLLDTATSLMPLTLTGTSGKDTLNGKGGNDTLSGLAGNDTLAGGKGDDLLNGGKGNDTYLFGAGDGHDTIVDKDSTWFNSDLLKISGAKSNQLWFSRSGNNLDVSVIGTQDRVTIQDWYLGSSNYVEKITAADGKSLSASKVQGLVNAMASFAPPAQGQTTLPANTSATITKVIASSWA
ncbi:MAG TPA: calcium-binding protein [Aquabacterium sp.]|uniref:beta strand repeat-containing protein n=1 Tax=Aquabacterium sp. TaxID=1872578 RepID=UPI002E2EBFCB|nr:calcium-binding protein [Aquabacterium sp.]HEX5356675.1 calcium-binding protein [Aquabacterium sp.]